MKYISMLVAVMLCGCQTDDFDFDVPPIVSTTTTTTQPVPTTTTTQPAVSDDNEHQIIPEQLYAPRYDVEGATEIKFGGGNVYNPNNSRKKLKVIFKGKYCNKIAWCVFFADGFQDKGGRAFPNESSNRPRFYSKTGIGSAPSSFYIRAHIVENGTANDVWLYVSDKTKRMD